MNGMVPFANSRRRTMKALMIPVPHNNKPCTIDLDERNELETYYKEIGCDCIDTCCLWRNNQVSIDAVVSDCGAIDGTKVNERFYMAYMDNRCFYPLYGIVIVVMTDCETGETIELDIPLVTKILTKYYGFAERDFWNLRVV